MTNNKQIFQFESNWPPSGSQPTAIAKMTENLRNNIPKQTLLGITGSGKTFSIAKTIEAIQKPTIVLAPNKTLAAQLYGEFKEFFPHNAVEYFVSYFDYYQPEAYVASTDTFIEKDSSINQQIEQMRLSATKALLERKDVIIVATVSSIYGLGNPESYGKMVLKVFKNQKMTVKEIIQRLVDLQYTRNNTQLERGTFRVRGDMIDIHPAENEDKSIRIEIFDDEIDSIKIFDPLTGKSYADVTSYSIYAKNHYVTEKAHLISVIPEIKNELADRLAYFKSNNKLVEAQRLEQRVNHDIEMMQEIGYCKGIENYSRYLTDGKPGEPPPCLFDYLPKDGIIVIDESHVTVPQLGAMYKGDRARKESLVNYGFRLPSALDNRPLKFEEFSSFELNTIYVSATPSDYEIQHSNGHIVEQIVRPTGLLDPEIEVRKATTQVDDLLGEIKKRVAKNERILVTTLTKKMAEDLASYMTDINVKAKYLHSDIDTIERSQIINDLRRGYFDVLIGINLLREGLDIPEVSLVAILDADKEGFLRSERSLIQTIGRSARNVGGKAILYGDKITNSMKKAIDETNRRRSIQIEYNKQNTITPTGINKEIRDVMGYKTMSEGKKKKIKDNYIDVDTLNIEQLEKMAGKLEKEMKEAAKKMEFETASIKRDALKKVKEKILFYS